MSFGGLGFRVYEFLGFRVYEFWGVGVSGADIDA